MIAYRLLRECARAAQTALAAEADGGFGLLFGWMAARIARQAGLENMPAPGRLPGALLERLNAVELDGCWKSETTLGWAYQAWNEPRRMDTLRRLYRAREKMRVEDLAAATQLFTPDWLADFLVQNTLGRLWLEMHPGSALRAALPALLPGTLEVPRPARPLREISVLDPACGTMHFGLAALPLLARMYREEQECAGLPGWPRQPSLAAGEHPAAAALRCNLAGADIDPRALWLAGVALRIRAARLGADALSLPAPRLRLLAAPLGSLQRRDGAPPADVVLSNPPYSTARNLPPALAGHLRQHYPAGRRDLYAAFILRALDLAAPGGMVGLLTQQSYLHLRSYTALRERLLADTTIQAVLLAGTGVFPGVSGEKANAAAIVVRHAPPPGDARLVCIRAERPRGAPGKQAVLDAALRGGDAGAAFSVAQPDLRAGEPWALWAPPGVLHILRSAPGLAGIPGADGHKTGANARFLRPRCQVPPEEVAAGRWRLLARPDRQMPYRQGFNILVDWSAEAQAFYRANRSSSPLPGRLSGLPGICWSRVATRRFNARRFPAGVIPDVASPAIYPAEEDILWLLALLNSRPARALLRALNPTINYALGDVRRLPLPPVPAATRAALAALALRAEAAAAALDAPALAIVESHIDPIVVALYGFSPADVQVIEQEIQP